MTKMMWLSKPTRLSSSSAYAAASIQGNDPDLQLDARIVIDVQRSAPTAKAQQIQVVVKLARAKHV
jgi:hypothetical protein